MPKSENILEKLFGSALKVKILRLFLLHPEDVLTNTEIVRRTRSNAVSVKRELASLKKIGFIKEATEEILLSFERRKKINIKAVPAKNKKKKSPKYVYETVTETKKKKIKGWKMDEMFLFLHALKNLVLNAAPISKDDFLRKIKKLGKVKLVVLSGIFIQESDSRIDILVVGDGIKVGVFEKLLKETEAEVGRELSYALMDTKEFLYRLGMYDKFVRDILDYPHEKLFNKLDV